VPFAMMHDGANHAFSFPQHFPIGKPNNVVAAFYEPAGPAFVIIDRLFRTVLITIQLDDQFRRRSLLGNVTAYPSPENAARFPTLPQGEGKISGKCCASRFGRPGSHLLVLRFSL
jgi:hypothetical protein